MKRSVLILLAILAAACQSPGVVDPSSHDGYEFHKMYVELLPDLNIPRSGHKLAYVGGELTVIGGHTTGFIPTSTAEYYSDGEWHLVNTLYPHDCGFCVVLPSEEIIVGGGCAEPFGIGQTWAVEKYDPISHSFSPLPILDSKRGANVMAARFSDGRIIVAGNWYAEDVISTYSPESGGTILRIPTIGRAHPLILQTSPDNAVVLGSVGERNDILPPVADRLSGDSFEVPLLQEWEDWLIQGGQQMSHLFIGDETVGGYAWLFPAARKSDGQLALIKVVGETFSVLETEKPLLMDSPYREPLSLYPMLLADRDRECAWIIRTVIGTSDISVTKVDYGEALRGGKAPVSDYRAELPDGLLAPCEIWATLLPGGRIAIVGGLTSPDNYNPSAAAFILHTEPEQPSVIQWWMIVCALVLLGAAGVFLAFRSGKGRNGREQVPEGPMDELMKRIAVQMEENHLFLRPGLTKEEVALAVGSNSRYVSDCINLKAGCSFIDFVNDYRIRYAQRLLYENPDMRVGEISEESGFSSEVTFYRNFKARTGQTPTEWLASQSRM